ncbi:DOMON domain-containing protein [Flagellimonas meishanensis]|uniref:DOMON domain-containing protein n=1 Tax=Flagellimonas meishanensis TaxID=2873264 RepID=UPI001CA5F4A9|nr:DOMON domain-containing protein [[Muricauda] meishanensis]
MKVSWEHHENYVTFTASAPDDGWVAIGFNSKNDIVDTNLIMVAVSDDKTTAEDFYVVSAGNPKPVKALGSKSQVIDPQGSEENGITTITFSMPVVAFDNYHFDLSKGRKLWLICAYSMEDEFDHHSRMRRHIEITL